MRFIIAAFFNLSEGIFASRLCWSCCDSLDAARVVSTVRFLFLSLDFYSLFSAALELSLVVMAECQGRKMPFGDFFRLDHSENEKRIRIARRGERAGSVTSSNRTFDFEFATSSCQ